MIVAVSMVRDEEDVIGHTLAHMLTQVDHAIIADNLSTDGTRAILNSFPHVTVVDDPVLAYNQADKMTTLAHQAGDMGATWVVPFDADEAWFLPDLDSLAAEVVTCRPHVYVPQPSDDQNDPNPITRILWRIAEPERQHKVCFRYHPSASLHMGQHDVNRPGRRMEAGSVRHYQYRTLEQVRRKVTNGTEAYAAAVLPSLYGSQWRDRAERDDRALEAWWDTYLAQPLEYVP